MAKKPKTTPDTPDAKAAALADMKASVAQMEAEMAAEAVAPNPVLTSDTETSVALMDQPTVETHVFDGTVLHRVVPAEAREPQEPHREPVPYVWLRDAGGALTAHPADLDQSYLIRVNGEVWHHTGEDEEGRWIYAPAKKT